MSRIPLKALVGRLEKWRWLLLALIGLSMLAVEIQEFRTLKVLNENFHFLEVFLFWVLLVSTGLLIEFFVRSSRAYRQAANLLAHKHRLSVELTHIVDSESMWEKLAEIPSGIVETIDCYLLLGNSLNGEYPVSVYWANPGDAAAPGAWNPAVRCQECLQETGKPFHLCRVEEDSVNSIAYKLELSGEDTPSAFLKFRVRPENKLSAEEIEIFSSIRDEIMLAIRSSRDRRRLMETKSAEVAVAERRSISTIVHDHLGQNLGFLHLKLDQLSASEEIRKHKKIHNEIGHLREVAGKSYDIVRDILKVMRPSANPHLITLLQEHGRNVTRRAGMKFSLKTLGTPVSMEPAALETILIAFREMVGNAERHSRATMLEVVVDWNDGLLRISVADNGRGFDPASVPGQDHYGLQILQERAASLDGTITISSQPNSGTVALLTVPLAMISVVPA